MLHAAGAGIHVFLGLLLDRDAWQPQRPKIPTEITHRGSRPTLFHFLTARPGTFSYDGAVFRSALFGYRQDRTFTPWAQTHVVSAHCVALDQPRRHTVPVKSFQHRRSLFPSSSLLDGRLCPPAVFNFADSKALCWINVILSIMCACHPHTRMHARVCKAEPFPLFAPFAGCTGDVMALPW